jgi:DDE superfamily endonuclease
MICDNLSTHQAPRVTRWLLAHPRFHLHFTPTGSSWLNLVERWFAEITVKLIRRGVHRSVKHLARDITDWAQRWNDNPKPNVWTKTADEILESLAAYCQRMAFRHPPARKGRSALRIPCTNAASGTGSA